jgi:hypothetical protein
MFPGQVSSNVLEQELYGNTPSLIEVEVRCKLARNPCELAQPGYDILHLGSPKFALQSIVSWEGIIALGMQGRETREGQARLVCMTERSATARTWALLLDARKQTDALARRKVPGIDNALLCPWSETNLIKGGDMGIQTALESQESFSAVDRDEDGVALANKAPCFATEALTFRVSAPCCA